MDENYLITGYLGEPHVTPENDRGINAGIVGEGKFVLPVGQRFKAEYIGNNIVRMYDGKLIDNGAAAGIPAGEYIDFQINNASYGMNRNDLICFGYQQEESTLIERGFFDVMQGTETSGTASDPEYSQWENDLLSGNANMDVMPLWRVRVSGSVISAPEQVFELSKSLAEAGSGSNIVVDAISSDGVYYEATVEDLEELYNGLEITIIPKTTSTTTAPTLNVNGLGAKPIRLSLSLNNSMLVQPKNNNYYAEGRPITLMFDSKYLSTGAWRVANKQRPSAEDLYGTTPVPNGGTGLDEIPVDSFIIGNGEEPMQTMTPDEMFDKFGGNAYELLWENTGSGDFAAQTITVPGLEKYHFAIVMMASGCYMMHNSGAGQTSLEWRYSNGYGMIYARNMWLNGNKIEFDDCYEIGIMNGMTTALNTANQCGKPYAVLGVRGLYLEALR